MIAPRTAHAATPRKSPRKAATQRVSATAAKAAAPARAAPTATAAALPAQGPGAGRLSLPPYETVALVLQGGGALGAYQAGVYQGLAEAGIEPNCFSGISIGALNTALIAGNPPERRIARLTEFWETICQLNLALPVTPFWEQSLFNTNDAMRRNMSALHAAGAVLVGQKGFFRPRMPPPAITTPGDPAAASYYDTSALSETLERLCDFDLINSHSLRVSVGAVNVRTGNFVHFDNAQTRLEPRHFLASGALPPAFPAIEIDGEYYWDGGLVSNTPLSYVLESRPRMDTLAFQVDLWSARGRVPTNMSEVSDRIQDIRYSSRTRQITDEMRRSQYLQHMVAYLLDKLPADEREADKYCREVEALTCKKRYNIIHLIYQDKPYEEYYKDYQFGPGIMRDHWACGLADIRATLAKPDYLLMPENVSGFITHDVHRTRDVHHGERAAVEQPRDSRENGRESQARGRRDPGKNGR